MELIKLEDALEFNNSDSCKLLEYSFKDKSMDLGVATITGRYPDKGYCKNSECNELCYILDGHGRLYTKDICIDFKKGDSILILKDEGYCWESEYAVIALICNPAFSKEQYELVD